eukprot:TRINITY_DN938_c0_g1_i2.p1 TRINITY_DN938_c0_g1~~TRINITY_DN938_c0_g1_i2.p1  ORF type:complete len:1270 (+),score=159.57 TRINITY_DN938_c0_g1_i2:89-3811(+)
MRAAAAATAAACWSTARAQQNAPCDIALHCSGHAGSVWGTLGTGCVCTCYGLWTGSDCSVCRDTNRVPPGCTSCKDRMYMNRNLICTPCDRPKHHWVLYSLHNLVYGTCECVDGRKASTFPTCELCQPGQTGANCDVCKENHVGRPTCTRCTEWMTPARTCGSYYTDVVDEYGQRSKCVCQCRWGFEGDACDGCAPGHISYPQCTQCTSRDHCSGNAAQVSDISRSYCTCTCRNQWSGPFCSTCNHAPHDPADPGDDCGACRWGYVDFGRGLDGICTDCSNPARVPGGGCSGNEDRTEPKDSTTCKCVCKVGYTGDNCERCAPKWVGYPNCVECTSRTHFNGHAHHIDIYTDTLQKVCLVSQCYTGWNNATNCRTCLDGYDFNRNCGACLPGWIGYPSCQRCERATVCPSNSVNITDDGNNWYCVCTCDPGWDSRYRCTRCKDGYVGTSCVASKAPTAQPSAPPTRLPSPHPTTSPTVSPSAEPSQAPSRAPSMAPSAAPTSDPTTSPSRHPSAAPSFVPSGSPSRSPTTAPSHAPSLPPSASPSDGPSAAPSGSPTMLPTASPSPFPSVPPTRTPSSHPTSAPTKMPTFGPSRSPSLAPTSAPTSGPTQLPSAAPTHGPSDRPTQAPTASPSAAPSAAPSPAPSVSPTQVPSAPPSASSPTVSPTVPPTMGPSASAPTVAPSEGPSAAPTSAAPSSPPTVPPTAYPTPVPTPQPEVPDTAVFDTMTDKTQGRSVAFATGVTGSSAGLSQVGMSLDTTCKDQGTLQNMSMILHPTQIDVAGSQHVGCLVGGVLIITGATIFSFTAVRVLRIFDDDGNGLLSKEEIQRTCLRHVPIIKKVDNVDLASVARHPNTILTVTIFVYQGMCFSAMRLAFGKGIKSSWMRVVGIVAALIGLAFPFWVGQRVRRGMVKRRLRGDPPDMPPMPLARLRRWAIPRPPVPVQYLVLSELGDWVSCRRERHWVNSWQTAVRPYVPERAAGAIRFELLSMWALGLTNAPGTPFAAACGHVRLGSAVVHLAQLAYMIQRCPYRCVRDAAMHIVRVASLAAAMLALSLDFYIGIDPEHDKVVLGFLSAATMAGLGRAVTNLIAEGVLLSKGYRAHIQVIEWDGVPEESEARGGAGAEGGGEEMQHLALTAPGPSCEPLLERPTEPHEARGPAAPPAGLAVPLPLLREGPPSPRPAPLARPRSSTLGAGPVSRPAVSDALAQRSGTGSSSSTPCVAASEVLSFLKGVPPSSVVAL